MPTTRQQEDTRKRRFIHQNQDIHGVAILRSGERDKTEVVREGHASGKDRLQFEDPKPGIEGELVAGNAWESR